MTASDERHGALGDDGAPASAPMPSPSGSPPRAPRLAPLALSCLALALSLWGLAQCDLALAQFLRSVQIPWLDAVGNVGNRLGKGWVLVGISAALLAFGVIAKRSQFRAAGIWSLIAHALAGLVTQLAKRTTGRARPRMTHTDAFQFEPSLASGLDSFPSGHATASFAVAVILAKYFPRAAWILYGLAAFVGLSRIVRGSHFPTDVAAGAILGLLVGLMVAGPWREWRTVLTQGVMRLTPYMAGFFALLWIVMQSSHADPSDQFAFAAGAMVALGGLGSRVFRMLRSPGRAEWLPTMAQANGLIWGGLALSTGSVLVAVVGGLVGITLCVGGAAQESPAVLRSDPQRASGVSAAVYLSEGALALALILVLIATQGLKGVLPLL